YNITPKSGTAPLRVGTGYLNSFFQGAMGDIAFYNRELSQTQIAAHTKAMGSTTTPTTPSAPGTTGAASARTWQHRVDGTNVKRTGNRLVRYTRAEGRRTRTNARGVEVVVVRGKVTAVRRGIGNAVIPAKGYVLSGSGTSRAWLGSRAKVGTTVRIAHGRVLLAAR
ncbi:hypothetical protein, partial [Marmoricola sp. RAF53]|uniref:hypothetical protein n=1 Tax=Marmoricola sp. RAF53 TaxID=3233059 RepID=UPI003F998058